MKRRFFLQGIGGAALAAPFLTSFVERTARAQAMTPVRNIIFFTHNGCITNNWFPTVENGPLTAGDLSPTLSPLADVVDKILIPRGFKSFNAYTEIQSIDPHDQAMGSKLTCAEIDPDNKRYATAVSVDHEMAKQMNPNGASPLILSVGPRSSSIKEVLSFSGPIEPYISEVNPAVIYNQLTDVLSNAVSDTGMTEPNTVADYKVLRGNSVIDLVREDLKRLEGRNMSVSDRQRVEAWLTLLRSTEQGVVSLATGSCTTAYAGGSLNVTDESVAAAGTGGGMSGGGGLTTPGSASLTQSFTLGGDMMLNLIALSAICDTNRSMGMIYPGYVTFDWDDIHHNHEHHGLSHRNGDFRVGAPCVANVMEQISQIDNWYAGKYAKLVKLLDSIPEGDRTVLDNSATVWLPELSDGNAHNQNNLPIVIAGSAGGKLKQGQAVNVEGGDIGQGNSLSSCQSGEEGEANSLNTGSFSGNVPINKLYVTLMNAYGMKAPDGGEWTEWGKFDSRGGTSAGITDPGEVTELKA